MDNISISIIIYFICICIIFCGVQNITIYHVYLLFMLSIFIYFFNTIILDLIYQ